MSTSTTTDRRTETWRLLMMATLCLAGWFAFVASLTALAQPTTRLLVFAPGQGRALEAILRTEGQIIIDMRHGAIVEAGLDPFFVMRLYRSGAWLVLPARSGPCGGRRV